MPEVVIIGGGHNGLVAACYLARAGLKPLVLEMREILGGAAVTEEFYPGFRASALAHAAGPFLPQIASELELERRGLAFIKPGVRVFAPDETGRSISIYEDVARTVGSLVSFSRRDARNYPAFCESFERIGRVLSPLLLSAPPTIDGPTAGELWTLGKAGREFRRLDKRDSYRLLRWGPMAVADLASEWFESELLRAVVAARGIQGSFAGPWSAGTSLGLLTQAALGDGRPFAPATFVRGGMGALTSALADAAREAGAEVRTNARVSSVKIKDGAACGVVLEGGEEIDAPLVVSNADPRTTFLKLVGPSELDPDFLSKVRAYRIQGSVAKINLALDALPEFTALEKGGAKSAEELSGRIHIGPEIDYLERAFDAAKYGDFSPAPYLDITIPTLTDPALAPEGKHVLSVYAHFAPYDLKKGDWETRAEEFGDAVVETLSRYAPNVPDVIIDGQLITPRDLEETYGLAGGHPHHGETSLEQFYAFRPVIGHAQYRTPIRNLYLCGAGTHPGGGVTGAPGLNASREILKDVKKARGKR